MWHSLIQDEWLDSSRIRVRVRSGVVTLSGWVESYLDARYAWDDTWETPGVRGVIDRLKVREGSEKQGRRESGRESW